jgi:hypothetical protein
MAEQVKIFNPTELRAIKDHLQQNATSSCEYVFDDSSF